MNDLARMSGLYEHANDRDDESDQYTVQRDAIRLFTIFLFIGFIWDLPRLPARTEIKNASPRESSTKLEIRLQESCCGERRRQKHDDPPKGIHSRPNKYRDQHQRNNEA